MNIQYLSVTDLMPHPRNPRTITKDKLEQLAATMKQDSITLAGYEVEGLIDQPIVVNEISLDLYQILSGHNRVEAAKILGWQKIACVVRQLNDADALALLMNRNATYGKFNHNARIENLYYLDAKNYNMQMTGHTKTELENLFAPVEPRYSKNKCAKCGHINK